MKEGEIRTETAAAEESERLALDRQRELTAANEKVRELLSSADLCQHEMQLTREQTEKELAAVKAESRKQLETAEIARLGIEAAREAEKKLANEASESLSAEKGRLIEELRSAKEAVLCEKRRFDAAQLADEEKNRRANDELDGAKREVNRLVLLVREMSFATKHPSAANEKMKEKLV
jgi:hypothetical protein